MPTPVKPQDVVCALTAQLIERVNGELLKPNYVVRVPSHYPQTALVVALQAFEQAGWKVELRANEQGVRVLRFEQMPVMPPCPDCPRRKAEEVMG